MLREAAAHAYLRSYKEPGTPAHDTLSTEISKLLTLTRVAMGEALTAEEEAGYGY